MAPTRLTSTSDPVTGTSANFSDVHETLSEAQGRFVDSSSNSLARFESRQVDIASPHQYNQGTFNYPEVSHPGVPVSQRYMSSPQIHTSGEQSNNITPQENLIWSHGGITPLIGDAGMIEQSTMQALSNQLRPPISFAAETVDMTTRGQSVMSGVNVPNLWNQN